MACKPNTKTEAPVPAQAETKYPEAFQKILDAHGGLDTWDTYKTLAFTIPGEPVSETHSIDLHSRKDHIQRGTASLGFDGEQAWLHDPENSYKGNPEFYHNLMFYFYAMPFVLADPGINYEETEALRVNDTTYPGLKISFEPQIGVSSNDEYYLYYDPETSQMRWLGYTATFGAEEKSDQINYIAYDNWTPVAEVLLPRSITWYAVENGQPTTPRRTVNFENVSLNTASKADNFYQKPALQAEN
tara:strand:+ start:332 stop:1063 length:732 start_codon:yes stop_codon:yes gene_type:complete